jgi:ketosteroid isomerase-like protein
MAVQSENERNKALVDEYFKAGVHGHFTSFAAYLHPDFTVTAPNYLPWGGRHVGATFFRDHLLSGVTDVFDFARFSYDNVIAEDGLPARRLGRRHARRHGKPDLNAGAILRPALSDWVSMGRVARARVRRAWEI